MLNNGNWIIILFQCRCEIEIKQLIENGGFKIISCLTVRCGMT